MPDFAYIARDIHGAKVTGTLFAQSEREAIANLSTQELFPLEVTQQKTASQKSVFARRVNGQTMAVTYSQLASLLRSGVPLLRAIGVIRDQSSNVVLKEVLDDVYRRVEEGTTLGEAMSRYPRVFSELAINMVKAGGEGGFLEEALDRVATFTEQYEDLKSRTTGALAYPIFLTVVGTAVVAVLIVFFVPKFASIFDSLRERGELPMMTDWLLWFSGSVRHYGWILLVIGVIAFLVAQARMATETGRRMADKWKLKIPLLGSIFQNLAVARFCRVLGTMLRNGVPILKSLEVSRDAAGNRVLSEAIGAASENISSGQTLAAPLASSGYFPKTVVEMISVAEESNTLDKVLVEIADGLERRTERRLELAVRLIEPILLLNLAGVVLFVVMALLLPVIKMSATV
ncbi:MAG: type II secretion system F family protein [Planctomycetaceae bacterium]|nr:type II secretion system F family protein [Planctomycetales bacterium]MCB9874910.1 type II secretion system F family protein [Planctomycetaceae bacterium]MCB9923764.1 type II secretion system F family protein [Planctomycetaceae bacterium]